MSRPERALSRKSWNLHRPATASSRLIAALLALLLFTGSSQPALAGCCDDALSCAGAVATGGLTCAVDGLITTVNNLIARVRDLRTHLKSLFDAEARTAQQGINDAADELKQTNQSAIGQEKTALAQADQVISQERSHTYVHSSREAKESQHTKTSESGTKPSSKKTSKSSRKSSGSSSAGSTVSASSTTKKHASSTSSSRSTVSTSSARSQEQGEVLQMLEKAKAAIETRIRGSEAASVEAARAAAEAQRKAESGVIAAVRIVSDLALAPLDGIVNYLQTLVAHPNNIFDPTSVIDSEVNSVTSALDNSMDQVAKAVTLDAEVQLRNAARDNDEIARLQKEIAAIEAEMEKVEHYRSATAIDHLARLIEPHGQGTTLASTSARHATSAHFAEKVLSARQRAIAIPKQRVEQFKQDMEQFKTMRKQARDAHALLPEYQKNFARHMDQSFAGKSAAEAARQRDHLIAEARTRFAHDERTRDAVIELLTRESNKRIGTSTKVRS
jgi:hypothetical protein